MKTRHDLEKENPDSLEALRIRISTATAAERSFIRYCAIIVAVLVLTAVAKSTKADALTVSVLGGLEVPTALIAKQVWIIRIFCTCLLVYAFAEWALAIIDVNRHPLSRLYGDQKSLVAGIADWWDRRMTQTWLRTAPFLDFMQKVSFIAMIVLIVVCLWTL
jgi:hypothetical protein